MFDVFPSWREGAMSQPTPAGISGGDGFAY